MTEIYRLRRSKVLAGKNKTIHTFLPLSLAFFIIYYDKHTRIIKWTNLIAKKKIRDANSGRNGSWLVLIQHNSKTRAIFLYCWCNRCNAINYDKWHETTVPYQSKMINGKWPHRRMLLCTDDIYCLFKAIQQSEGEKKRSKSQSVLWDHKLIKFERNVYDYGQLNCSLSCR